MNRLKHTMLSPSWILIFSSCLVILQCWASQSSLTSPLGPVVNLGYAVYVGNSTSPAGELNSSVTFFGGIPYAQPPVGDLRFRAPKALDESPPRNGNVGIVDARNWGPPCIQSPAQVGIGSEGILIFERSVFFPRRLTKIRIKIVYI